MRRDPDPGAHRRLQVEPERQDQRGIQASERDRIKPSSTTQEPVLGESHHPVAVRETRLIYTVRARQLDLGWVPAAGFGDRYAYKPCEHRDRDLTGDDDDGANDCREIGLPDLAALDQSGSSPASSAAASSICVSSLVSGVSAYARA